jgi:hypothetical protein
MELHGRAAAARRKGGRMVWDPTKPAVHREDLIGHEGPALSLLRHPSYPFHGEIPVNTPDLFAELRRIAEDYLEKVKELDQPLCKALAFLKEQKPRPNGFGWLPITWGPAGLKDPRGSFAVWRSRNGKELDRTVVLMAGNRSLEANDITGLDGFAVGLRVVMHVDPATRSKVPIRVTGLSMCNLDRVDPGERPEDRIKRFLQFVARVIASVADQLGFPADTVDWSEFEDLSSQDSALLRIGGVGARQGKEGMRTGVLWTAEVRPTADDEPIFLSLRKEEQQTYAAAPNTSRQPKVFLQDPASSGPPHDSAKRSPTRDAIDDLRVATRSLPKTLKEQRFEVRQSVVADPDNNPCEVQEIDPLELRLRSDHLSAAHAFVRAQEFFKCLSDFDLSEEAYFKFAQLPLLMRHRAGFRGSPDGKTVRAQVRVVGSPMRLQGEFKEQKRPQLEVAFGSVAWRHRAMHRNKRGRLSAQPLGIAADPRWAWHEFGHVLSYAATGALEFEFAHSVGDALAAVLNDPHSQLAGDSLYDGETFHGFRPGGGTIAKPRPVGAGVAGATDSAMRKPRFRRCSTRATWKSRCSRPRCFAFTVRSAAIRATGRRCANRAAAAAAYLLMRATLLLGPAPLVPARSADALVSAMIDADIGTRPRTPDQLFRGGCLHKVVRWSFERQGLFATDSPGDDVDGPGLPPKVDLWVKDRRPSADEGGYEPVTLEWPAPQRKAQQKEQPEPAWFAASSEVDWKNDRAIQAIVRNRGVDAATKVAVRAWAAPAGSDSLGWRPLGHVSLRTVPGGGFAPARIAARRPAAQHYLLVEISASGDRSNLDLATGLPCATGSPPSSPEELRDLVVNDNNLALRLIGRGQAKADRRHSASAR